MTYPSDERYLKVGDVVEWLGGGAFNDLPVGRRRTLPQTSCAWPREREEQLQPAGYGQK